MRGKKRPDVLQITDSFTLLPAFYIFYSHFSLYLIGLGFLAAGKNTKRSAKQPHQFMMRLLPVCCRQESRLAGTLNDTTEYEFRQNTRCAGS
jgi:hypothetical protein